MCGPRLDDPDGSIVSSTDESVEIAARICLFRLESRAPMESVGQYLRKQRESKRMSIEEVSRATRVPIASVERIEADQFDELPGEVFVRGFLKSYAQAVGLSADEVLARYTASRRIAWVTPLPLSAPGKPAP